MIPRLGVLTRREPQHGAVLRLGLPAIGEQFLSLLVGLVNTYVVGHLDAAVAAQAGYTRTVALASVGIGAHIVAILTTLFIAVALGCTIVLARFVGARDWAGADRTLYQALIAGLGVGLIALLTAYLWAADIMRLFGIAPEIRQHGVSYTRIVAYSFPIVAIMYVGNAALRGAGNTRTPLYVMLWVNGINSLLSFLLVNGQLPMLPSGVEGAAWAAMTAQCVGGLTILVLLIKGHSGLQLRRMLPPDTQIMRRIFRQSIPFCLEQLLFQLALLIIINLINDIGAIAYVTHVTLLTLVNLSFLPGQGFAVAATTLVSQSMGAKRVDGAFSSSYAAFWYSTLCMGLIGAFFVVAPEVLIRFFVADEAIVQAAALPLRMVGLTQPALAASFIFSASLRGGGDPKWPLASRIFSMWFIRVPVASLLVYGFGWGLNGVWLALCIDFYVQGLIVWWRFQRGAWQHLEA